MLSFELHRKREDRSERSRGGALDLEGLGPKGFTEGGRRTEEEEDSYRSGIGVLRYLSLSKSEVTALLRDDKVLEGGLGSLFFTKKKKILSDIVIHNLQMKKKNTSTFPGRSIKEKKVGGPSLSSLEGEKKPFPLRKREGTPFESSNDRK